MNALQGELCRFGKSYVKGCGLNTSDEDAVKAAISFFGSTPLQWVLVLDDVRHWDDVRDMVPLGQGGRVLVTSVDQSMTNINTTELPLFSMDESLTVGCCIQSLMLESCVVCEGDADNNS